MMTPQDLARLSNARIDRATEWLPEIDAAMKEFEINTPIRQAMFLAQIGYESSGFRNSTEIWGPSDQQHGYEGRKDLGNVVPGDGYKFKGRGLIQLTGRANYAEATLALDADLLTHPELLGEPVLASRSAAWFWKTHGCNELADQGDFLGITKRINGGTNGLPQRWAIYQAGQKGQDEPT